MIRLLRSLVALAPLAVSTVPAWAQAPKPGDYWEDRIDLGFRVRVPKEWALIPPQPGEQNVIARWEPKLEKEISVGKGHFMLLAVWLVKFDDRPRTGEADAKKDGDGAIIIRRAARKSVVDWVKKDMSGPATGERYDFDPKKYPKSFRCGKIEGQQWVFDGFVNNILEIDDDAPVRCFAVEVPLPTGVRVAFVGIGPADTKKWHEYEKSFEIMAKSIAPLEVTSSPVGASTPTDPRLASPRDKKRELLQKQIATQPGWRLEETENYLIVTDVDDEPFIEEIKTRLEAIHDVYERDYPIEKARKIYEKKSKKKPTGEDGGGEDEGADAEPSAPPGGETVAPINAMDLAKASVVRVCKNRADYNSYGGPGGSAGYWAAFQEELVFYDDQAGGGRSDTWIVLNHEAFHQYIFYFYGADLDPHGWYNEGTGDFYSGYEYEHKKFKLKENSWRVREIQQMIREGVRVAGKDAGFAPLEELVRWGQGEYYGANSLGQGIGECYAQGWSLIYFLRTGKQAKAHGWNDRWDKILDRYLETLATTSDLDEAVDAAFEGIDWDAFQESWADYVASL
jgi:hypothetical protein